MKHTDLKRIAVIVLVLMLSLTVLIGLGLSSTATGAFIPYVMDTEMIETLENRVETLETKITGFEMRYSSETKATDIKEDTNTAAQETRSIIKPKDAEETSEASIHREEVSDEIDEVADETESIDTEVSPTASETEDNAPCTEISQNTIDSKPTPEETTAENIPEDDIIPEVHETTEAVTQQETEATEVVIQKEEPTPIPQSIDTGSKNITEINIKIDEPSGLSAEQLDKLLEYVLTEHYPKSESKLRGQGAALKEIEDTYNVNALFALSISSLETGWGCGGTSYKNNMFGFNSGKEYWAYDTVADSILSFGKVLRESYFDKSLTTLSTIAPIYCPVSSPDWADYINWFMDFYAESAILIL